ncbi:MAG: CehA/McbA family metallohydrolase [Sphaerochaeta sp.]|nr:CehA/McbA family metallohydrolase [Sphaerochaeta sp.]
MKHRYTGKDNWFKGNTHTHTTLSDGGLTPSEVTALYAQAGYDFVAITDHWHAFRKQEMIENDNGLLVLDGIEIDGTDDSNHYYHVVALGTFDQMDVTENLSQTMDTLIHKGAYLILAHPYWSGNHMEDVKKYPFHAIEVYNHVCAHLNGKSTSLPYWDGALFQGLDLMGISADDAHLLPQHPGWKGGWIMVQAPVLSDKDILKALQDGNFYATTGPEFHSIFTDETSIRCKTSPIQRAWLVGEGYKGDRVIAAEGETLQSFSFSLDPDSPLAKSSYLRLEIEDSQGKRAWSNPL